MTTATADATTSMLSHVCHGKIAVVGNGPLTQQDRDQIRDSGFDCVVRFNDRKNLREGEHTTVHVVRDTRHWSDAASWIIGEQRRVPGLVPGEDVFVQPVTARPTAIQTKFEGSAHVLPPILVYEKNADAPAEQYFPECDACRSGGKYDCATSATDNGPSTGTALIHHLNARPETTELHVFGMNWNGGDHHFDFKQPTLLSDCCAKCKIHPTQSSNYIPAP